VFAAEPVAALSCVPPDPWFLTTVSASETMALPEGVFVRVAPRRTQPTANEPPWDNSVLNWLEVENTNPQPLYVLEDADEYRSRMGYEAISWPEVDLGGAPVGMRTGIKLQNSSWYAWPTNCAVVKCEAIDWHVGTGNLMITDGGFGLSHGFQERVTRSKHRPANVDVPQPQPAVMTLSYGGRVITVPFVVTYQLNQSYDPANGTDNCGAGLTLIAELLLLFVVVAIALPVVVLVRLFSKWLHRASPA
jgi:hypothetical protein